MVLELIKGKELEAALLRLTDKLARITAALRNKPRARESAGLGCAGLEHVCAGPAGLLEGCLSEARGISQLLYDSPPSAAVRHDVANGQSIAAGPEYLSPLCSREREVVTLLTIGKTNREIGSKLLISTRTVESHRARIMLKLDLHSLSDLLLYAVRSHLIQA